MSWQGRCVAALLLGGEGAAISHAAAAVLHGLMAPPLSVDEITEREGIRVTTVERTLFDLCDPRLVTEAIARGLTSLSALSSPE